MPCSPPENLDQEFDFYIRFVKPLVLNLPEANDRVKAAAWIQKLRSVTDDLNLRNEYLKLFLFALQRKRLVGPFSDVPPDTLEPFPEGYGLTDMMKCLIELDAKEDRSGVQPPCTTEISSDLKEYAAVQQIPNYGVHCYLAISNEPLPKWERADQVALPPGVMRPKDSTPEVSTLKTGVSWVDSLRRSPCKKSKSEAPCGTCQPPEPCKPVSSTTSYRKPCSGGSKKPGKKKRFTDDELPGFGVRDPEVLDMADALLCSPSLVKRELFLEDHDIFSKDLHTIFAGEKAVEAGEDEDDDDDDDEGQSEFGYACGEGGGAEEQGEEAGYEGEVDEGGSGLYDAASGSGRFELMGGYPVYNYPGVDLNNITPMSSGILRAPASHRDSRPPVLEQRQAFIGIPPEPFNKPYGKRPFPVCPPSWMYPDAPHYRGNDEPIPTPELVGHIWQNQDEIQRFPWDISFVPDRPVEFHEQRGYGPVEDASFHRFRLVPPRLAGVPKEERPQTVRFFHLYDECSPSQYEELLRQEEGVGGGEEEEESQYYDAYP